MNLSLLTASLGASESLHVFKQSEEVKGIYFKHKIDWSIAPLGVGKVTTAKIMIQGSKDNSGVSSGVVSSVGVDGAIISPQLVVGSTATNIAHGLFQYLINGVNVSKDADAGGVVFSAVHKVAASRFGGIAVYINEAGDISTKINNVSQTATLSFDDADTALTNVQTTTPTLDTIRIGIILIGNNGSLWNANTENLTPGEDVNTSTFFSETSSFTEIDEYTLNAPDFINQKGVFYLDDNLPDNYIRLFLSEMTGNGTFSINDTLIPFRRTHVQDAGA